MPQKIFSESECSIDLLDPYAFGGFEATTQFHAGKDFLRVSRISLI
jgi:hypothetical protein